MNSNTSPNTSKSISMNPLHITFRWVGLLLLSTMLLQSCSKDEGQGNVPDPLPVEPVPLVLTASAMEIDAGEAVTFEVSAEGQSLEADIYVNGSKITGMGHTFVESGSHQVLAKKEGYEDSDALTVDAYQVNVYVGGYQLNELSGFESVPLATYWKNGKAVPLTDGSKPSMVFDITIHQGDVYAAGLEYNGSNYVAKYWKNGSEVILEGSPKGAAARSITVVDGDVYVAGNEREGSHEIAKYWVNGTPVALTNGESYADAVSIAVADGDVHVAGYEVNDSLQIAKYWVNGTPVELTDGEIHAEARSIAVADGDVLVAGYIHDGMAQTAVYWKNGEAVALGTSPHATANAIFVADGDVYVAVTDMSGPNYVAKYWKNDTPVVLTDGAFPARANSIFVDRGNVYVAGASESETIATYWKNGTPITLEATLPYSFATSLVVARSLGED